jgi:hypothetical protein
VLCEPLSTILFLILGVKMKSIIKIIVAALAISAVGFAMANANPAKGANGKPGYQAFCEELKKDCAKTRKCEYEEKRLAQKI